MSIIRILLAVFSFPGVVFHELGHELFCKLVGVRVRKVCYFRFGSPSGYVIHDGSRHFYQAFLIAIGPFVSGTCLSVLFFAFGLRAISLNMESICYCLGASIAISCLPSGGDAKTLWAENRRHLGRNFLAILGLPFAFLVWILSKMNSVWLGVAYAGLLFAAAVVLTK